MMMTEVMIQDLDQGEKKDQKLNQKLEGLFVWNWVIRRKKTTGFLD